MSRKAIGILYMLGVVFEMLGGVELLRNFSWWGRSPLGIVAGGILVAAAIIMGFIAWIGMLINLAKAQAWTMFTLAFFFSGIILLIYLFSDARTFAAKTAPPPQPWLAQPERTPSPSASYPSSYQSVIFKYGVIAGGMLQVITPVCIVLNDLLTFGIARDLVLDNVIYLGLPLFLSLPVFFWVCQAAARRVVQDKAGLAVALRAYGWLMITCGLLFLLDMLHWGPLEGGDLSTCAVILFTDVVQAVLFLAAAYGLGILAGHSGARQGVAAQLVNMPPSLPTRNWREAGNA